MEVCSTEVWAVSGIGLLMGLSGVKKNISIIIIIKLKFNQKTNIYQLYLGLAEDVTVPKNECFPCWVMPSIIIILCHHFLLTAVWEMKKWKCATHFLLFSRVFSSYFFHTLINSAQAGSETYLWLKLFSFLRQWRVTILWPSLLTSWLTVHITGLLALAPRNATPSFSLTLKHTHIQVKRKLNDTRNVTTNFGSETHLVSFMLSFSDSHTNLSKGKQSTYYNYLRGHKNTSNSTYGLTQKKDIHLLTEQNIQLDGSNRLIKY